MFLTRQGPIVITEFDLRLMDPIVDNRVSWLTPTMQRINEAGTHWATPVVGWATIVAGLAARRIRHVLLLFASLLSVTVLVAIITNLDLASGPISRPRPLGMTVIGEWDGFAQPSRPAGLLAAAFVAAGLTLVPAGRGRRYWWLVAVGLSAVFAYGQLYTGVEHPTDILAGATVGVAFTLLLYRLVAPEAVFPIAYRTGKTAHLDVTGARGEAIRRGLRDQLGVEVTGIEPVGLAGSSGSTPLRIVIEQEDGSDPSGPTELFAKLYARSHLRSDRSYKLFRTLVYGRLEDETRYTSVRRLVQHEDHMLHVMQRAGVPTAEPYGIVEITPDREYLLVTEFLPDAVEIGKVPVTDQLIDEGLDVIVRMWKSGLAHRDIKPANLMVAAGHLRVIDLAFGEIRPSPWRQAVDLANMMLVLALGSSPERVYERALNRFSEDEIAEAFAASRGVTLPSALRADVRRDGRDLLERFRRLAPARRRVSIQRWSLRRLGLTAWVLLLGLGVGALVFGNLSTVGLTAPAAMPAGTVRAPFCEGNGSGLIVAQSVPSARIIPCIAELPEGWSVAAVSVNQDRTIVRLDSDRAGDDAAVLRFDGSCELGDAVPVPSDDPRIDRYEDIERLEPDFRATWYAVVEGACWWWEFDFVAGASATLAVRVDNAVGWITRAELNANLAEGFVDAEI